MPLDADRLDALQKLPALKGPSLSIMVALMIAQRPLQAIELQSFTGYKNQAVTAGLRTLGHFRAVVDLGRGRGWALTPLWQQLMLPLDYVDHENHDLDHENHDLNVPSSGSSRSTNLRKMDLPTNYHGDGGDHENHDLQEKSANYGEITPPKKTAPEITARSGSLEITAVAHWLNKAGIETASYHWEKILALGHKPEYVKAHVLELLAGQGGLPGAEEIKTGALIYRLEHNWKSPGMRCEECLKRERECRCGHSLHSQIPDEYKDIIKR